ncbi:hypothetical protein Bbelb_326070 [Branchiostoma belcheri]|nr:hypothetical protein Bbelb_326070 [Branchiostoma belcheri]
MRLFVCILLVSVAAASGEWSFWNMFGGRKDQLLRQDDDEEIIPDEDCYTGKGEKYKGKVFLTEKDEMCLRWDSSEVLFRSFNVLTHPDGEYGVGEHNYCRNPAPGIVGRPWCYVSSDNDWDYCNILKCLGTDDGDDKCATPVCNNICAYGFKKDERGCDTCDCKDPPGGKPTTAKPTTAKPTPKPTTKKPEEKTTAKPKETTKAAPTGALCPAIDLSGLATTPVSSCPSGLKHTVGKVCWVMCTNGAPIEIATCQEDGTWSKDLSKIICKESAPKVPDEPTTPKVEATTKKVTTKKPTTPAPVKTTAKKTTVKPTTVKPTTVKPTVAKTTRKPEAAEKPDPATMGPKTAPPTPASLTKTCPKLNIPEGSLTNCYGAEQKVQTSCGVLCLKSDKAGPITMTTTCLEDGKWSKPKEGKLACEVNPIIPPGAMSDGSVKMPTDKTTAKPGDAAKPTKAPAAKTEKPTKKPTVKPTTKAPDGTDVTCFTSRGQNYRGKQATTRDGQLCMKWSDPLLKYYYYNTFNFGKKDGLGDHRYCRNPAPESEPWCYYKAVNGQVEYKVCGVPKC